MDENLNKEPKEEINLKKNFFKKAKYSIFNVEKYPEMAAEGVPRAIKYLIKIIAIFVIIFSIGIMYKIGQGVNEAVKYIESDFPDFSYEEGILDIKIEEPIIIEDNTYAGSIIIDTKTKDAEQINKYTNDIIEKGNGIIVLNNKIVLKNEAIAGTASYEYKEIISQLGITRFEKQDLINYTKGRQMISLYISAFITIVLYCFIVYFLDTLVNVFFVSAFGYIASMVAKIKMRYAAIFNMSVYAMTLSTILYLIYNIITMFTTFTMQYFEVMYISVAVIYLFAAIFIIKADFIKRKEEIMKIVEVQKEVKKEIEEKEKEENKEPKKKEKNKKEKDDEEQDGPEPEGSKA